MVACDNACALCGLPADGPPVARVIGEEELLFCCAGCARNLVAIPLAAGGAISPILAALAMAASSLLVVANSLRLRCAAYAHRPE